MSNFKSAIRRGLYPYIANLMHCCFSEVEEDSINDMISIDEFDLLSEFDEIGNEDKTTHSGTEEFKEAIKAFIEKRDPIFI